MNNIAEESGDNQKFSQYLFWLSCKFIAREAQDREILNISKDWEITKREYVKGWLMSVDLHGYKRTQFNIHIQLKKDLETLINISEGSFKVYLQELKKMLREKMVEYYSQKILSENCNPKIKQLKDLWSSE